MWQKDLFCGALVTLLVCAVRSQGDSQAELNALCTGVQSQVEHPTDCNKFVQCHFGYAHVMSCPRALRFDINTLSCQWPFMVQCNSGQGDWVQPTCWFNRCRKGTCVETAVTTENPEGYVCNCYPGYTGEYCNYDINECAISNPCLNGGTCVNMRSTYRCDCTGTGYEGANCDTATCDIPCRFGTCVRNSGITTCQCFDGYQGSDCGQDIDECAGVPCQNGGVCTDLVNGFSCNCANTGFQGDTCSLTDNCFNNPCQNGGFCLNTNNNNNGFVCNCDNTGFSGTTCSNAINNCQANSCLNGGLCIDNVNGFTCDCSNTGYTGDNCQTDINECANNPCNGGFCTDLVNSFLCDCSNTGFTGATCQQTDFCANGPCQNGGRCSNLVNTFSCDCAGTGFGGNTCETSSSFCLNNNCQNGAVCVEGSNGYTCNCANTGYTGQFCTDANFCLNNNCANNAVCVEGFNSYTCNCANTGYTGQFCTDDVNECQVGQDPCLNGGQCVNTVGGVTCDCSNVNFEGSFCETPADTSCAKYTCPDNINEHNYPSWDEGASDCTKYYSCRNGALVKQTCDPGLQFDVTMMRCSVGGDFCDIFF